MLYEQMTKEELIKKLNKCNIRDNTLPTKDELQDEISHLRQMIREMNTKYQKLLLSGIAEYVPSDDKEKNGYVFLLEENNQLHKELENCREIIDEYIVIHR